RESGEVRGTVLMNGREEDDENFKKVVGYVEWEDTLVSTLTVYETVLYSALLCLSRSREINDEARKFRMLEMLAELGFFGYQGCADSGYRSIYGGEKQVVSIACELVTSPFIIFLGE
ncbi:hypothetical protein BDN70DRAFT_773657, partial [Pholiota conissans]